MHQIESASGFSLSVSISEEKILVSLEPLMEILRLEISL